ncbi:MAG: AMP-binding protein, partial [Terracidiphilus sp.]
MRDNLATLLDDFRRYGRQIAVVRIQGNRRRTASYDEIARLARRFAALLAGRGVGPGERILLWGENSAEWIAAFYGCLLRGALAVPLDAYGTAEFARRVAAEVRPRLAVGDGLLLAGLPEGTPTLAFEEWNQALPEEEAGPIEGLSRETPLEILFTSGTTGDPKGVVLTHGNVLASVGPIEQGARPYLRYERLVHPLRILHTLPLSHVFGQTMGLWIPPILSAEVHFESRLVAARLVETIHRERISVLAAVPRVMALVKAHLEATHPGLAERLAAAGGIRAWQRWWRFRDVHRALGLKFWALVSGGGALGAPIEQFWNALGFVVIQGYGMTETSALITLNHPFHVARGTIGKPLPGREVRLAPDGEVLVRGAMISTATWAGGELQPRPDEWLATGDLAETEPGGELRFVGRKSEVIVTATGVNLHPEDLEEAIEQEPEVAACAVVPVETPSGPEPCAVLVLRAGQDRAAAVIEAANRRLAEFQRLRRWVLWPEPDLPRTSTGKVRRKAVAAWLAGIQPAAPAATGTIALQSPPDWLLALVAEITGEAPAGAGNDLRLSEDLHLDSLQRVQLAAALEERLGVTPESGLLEEIHTLGELRALASGIAEAARKEDGHGESSAEMRGSQGAGAEKAVAPGAALSQIAPEAEPETARADSVYPRWPWLPPCQWLRAAFIEFAERPLVAFLAHPRIVVPQGLAGGEPMLIVANHVTTYDGPLVQCALPGPLRRRLAVAMSGEMLDDFRHARHPHAPPGKKGFYPWGPPAYWLLTALF